MITIMIIVMLIMMMMMMMITIYHDTCHNIMAAGTE